MTAAYKMVKYIKATPGQGLFFPSNSFLQLKAFCDSDWGGCQESRRSLTEYCIMLGNSLVSWKCKKQHVVSRSSTEAEYCTMADTCFEVVWLVNLLWALQSPTPLPISFSCDNKSAIYIASNPVFHERTKYIELDCYFVREKLQEGLISPCHISTNVQPADMFTKTLSSCQLISLQSKLGVSNLFAPPNLRGDVTICESDSESAKVDI